MPLTCLGLQDDSADPLAETLDEASQAFLLRPIDRLRDKTGHAIVNSIAKFLIHISAEITVRMHVPLEISYLSSNFEPTPDACNLIWMTDTIVSV